MMAVTYSVNEWMNEWRRWLSHIVLMNEWMNEWMKMTAVTYRINECMNEWMNEWMNEDDGCHI